MNLKKNKINRIKGCHTDGQDTYEKTFNHTHHQRNVNLKHMEISPHTCQGGYHQ